ncbi:hypothetical protein J31TS4_41370 [Paenibacillus sp. J31TS4]|uniref:gluconate 2-dehydrogenase subunit 3 family protein n=1 Tax=Paenibacillus sp. J31TS4 TaxID=2807195 RepID=UPI001B1695DA|nr:gluconate 2-dehydrogenase subunit 3 family protein [Paenibacillus sp. J31TS4]GIP40857.1 hypothetical protein J31TS4_41370 [Paenibacillus sp. J31TS4]
MPTTPNKDSKPMSRRAFLRNSGLALGGVVLGGAFGTAIWKDREEQPQEAPPGASQTPAASGSYQDALMFFNQEQFRLTEAAVERIYPEDEHGPGAKKLGVAYYIDHQLAGNWGSNTKDYMMGPFSPGEATQGYQGRLTRASMFLIGLNGLKDYSQKTYGKAFPELEEAEQDEVLKAFEKGDKVKLNGTDAPSFFKNLRTFTLEGVYADPMYGGNKDMQGWKMRNYPGNQMSYYDQIEKDGLVKLEPKSLRDHMA